MKTIEQLRDLDDHELVSEVLKLQKQLTDLTVNEATASQIHKYHFAGCELLKLNRDKFLGSGVIITICSLKGKPIVKPIMLSDGLTNDTINCLMDELQYTYDRKTEFKPLEKRL